MRFYKISISFLLLAALLTGCIALPPFLNGPTVPTTLPTIPASPSVGADPTQGTTIPGNTSVAPADPTTAPTDPTTLPTTAPTELPTDPTTEPSTEPPTDPTEPTELPTDPTEPSTEPPTDPTELPTEPPTDPTQPTECSHSYRVETEPATCTTAGKETKTCTKCGDRQVKTTAALGHAYGEAYYSQEAATCADFGVVRYDCTRCGHGYEATYRGNHRFGDPFFGSPHGYKIACQDCGYEITDFYTWFENSFSNCDKNAALYTDTIQLKEPVYTGLLSQWSDTWLDWHNLIFDVLSAYGHGGYSSGEYGVGLCIYASVSDYGSLDAFVAELNRFLDAFESVYNWRPVWDFAPEVYGDDICVGWETSVLMPVYEKGTNAMSSSKRDALIKDLVAFHIHQMDLRSGMQLYNSVGKICDYMQYRLLTYDHNYRYGSAFRGLTCGVTVCQGYAEIFQLFAEYCGITSELVTGTLHGTSHAWNRVTFSDGTVRYVDVTNLGADYFILVPWSHMAELGFKMK